MQNDWGAAMISRYAYESDALGRRDSVLRTGQAFGQTHFDLYDYNPRNELIDSDRYDGADPENPNPMDLVDALCYDWEYDPIGNREEYTDGTNPTTNYTVNDVNQYTSTTDPTESFTHDADGNMTADGTLTYVWDAENRLIEVYPTSPETGNKKLVFAYDYMGRRVRKLTYEWTGTIWSITPIADRRFIYENWLLLLELDGLDSNAVIRKYSWGLDISGSRQGAAGIGGLLATHDASTSKNYAYFYDANGNVGQLIDTSDGSIDAHYEYDPYGNFLATTGIYATINPFCFSTKYLDAETSLYYYGYRYYSPRLGRWISTDPIQERGGINLFGSFNNDPISWIDPDGLTPPTTQRGASTQPTEDEPEFLLIHSADFLFTGNIDVVSWLGRLTAPGLFALVTAWTEQGFKVKNNYVASQKIKSGFGAIVTENEVTTYTVPETDTSEYTTMIPISLKLTAPMRLKDKNGKNLPSLTNSFNEVGVKGNLRTRQMCTCAKGKITLEMDARLNVLLRKKGKWTSVIGGAKPKITKSFNTCSARNLTAIGHVSGYGSDQTHLKPYKNKALDLFGLRLGGGRVRWNLRIEGTLYELGRGK